MEVPPKKESEAWNQRNIFISFLINFSSSSIKTFDFNIEAINVFQIWQLLLYLDYASFFKNLTFAFHLLTFNIISFILTIICFNKTNKKLLKIFMTMSNISKCK